MIHEDLKPGQLLRFTHDVEWCGHPLSAGDVVMFFDLEANTTIRCLGPQGQMLKFNVAYLTRFAGRKIPLLKTLDQYNNHHAQVPTEGD